MHYSWPQPSCWEIASWRIQFPSGWLAVCFLHSASRMTRRSHHVDSDHCRTYVAMGARLQSVWDQIPAVQQVAGILLFGGELLVSLVCRKEFLVADSGWKMLADDCMVFCWSCRHSRCTWRWWPLSCNMSKGEHLRRTITTFVQVISLPLWPITWISLACAGGGLQTVCHAEWRVWMKLRSTWKWLLRSQVTIPMRRMLLIGLFTNLPVIASGSGWIISQWFWIVFTTMFNAQ